MNFHPPKNLLVTSLAQTLEYDKMHLLNQFYLQIA